MELNSTEPESTRSSPAVTLAIMPFSICFLLGNLASIIAVCKTPSLRSTRYILTANLAVSDSLAVIPVILENVQSFRHASGLPDDIDVCLWQYTINLLWVFASAGTLVMIAIDRLLYIAYPFKYASISNRKCDLTLVVTPWIIATSYSFCLFKWNIYTSDVTCTAATSMSTGMVVVMDVLFSICLGTLMCLYVVIIKIALRHQKRVFSEEPGIKFTVTRLKKKYLKTVKMFVFVTWTFFFGWLVALVVTNVEHFNGRTQNSKIFYIVGAFLLNSSSGVNSVIYAWKDASMRIELKRIICCTK